LLLANALDGNSKTAMIGTLSPAQSNYEETTSTLSFAATVKNIKLSAQATATQSKDQQISSLKAELEKLKADMAQEAGPHGELDESGESLEDDGARQEARRKLIASRWQLAFVLSKVSFVPPLFPYLVNVSDDPHLRNKISFHVPQNSEWMPLGGDKKSKFHVTGLGIEPTHAYICREAVDVEYVTDPAPAPSAEEGTFAKLKSLWSGTGQSQPQEEPKKELAVRCF